MAKAFRTSSAIWKILLVLIRVSELRSRLYKTAQPAFPHWPTRKLSPIPIQNPIPLNQHSLSVANKMQQGSVYPNPSSVAVVLKPMRFLDNIYLKESLILNLNMVLPSFVRIISLHRCGSLLTLRSIASGDERVGQF